MELHCGFMLFLHISPLSTSVLLCICPLRSRSPSHRPHTTPRVQSRRPAALTWMPDLVLLPISISTLPLLQHPLAIRGTMTWLSFTPLHFIVDGSLQQMVLYLWRTQREERDELLSALHILPFPPPWSLPHCPTRKERKQIMWMCSWLMKYRWRSAFLTPTLNLQKFLHWPFQSVPAV